MRLNISIYTSGRYLAEYANKPNHQRRNMHIYRFVYRCFHASWFSHRDKCNCPLHSYSPCKLLRVPLSSDFYSFLFILPSSPVFLSFFFSLSSHFRNQTQLLLTAIRANARFPVSGTSFSFHCSRDKLLRKQRISTYAILCKDSRTLGNLIIRETWLTSLNNAASKEKGTRDNRQINFPARGIEDYLSNDA